MTDNRILEINNGAQSTMQARPEMLSSGALDLLKQARSVNLNDIERFAHGALIAAGATMAGENLGSAAAAILGGGAVIVGEAVGMRYL